MSSTTTPPPPKKSAFTRLTRAQATGREKIITLKLDASHAGPQHRYVRAELELRQVEHRGASFEVRFFLNNSKATQRTPTTAEDGYAGSSWVFGHGRCYGDEGHCLVPEQYREEDRRRPHPLTPLELHVDVTEAVRRVVATTTKLTVTLVPIIQAANDACDLVNVLEFEALALVTYNLTR